MKRIGFTSGSFDPVTNGHLDVIRRAARMVDELVIGIGVHPGKAPLFTTDEKIEMLKAETAPIAKATGCTIEISTFDKLTVDAAKAVGATLIFRGLRDGTDFDYEMQMSGMNGAMAPGIDTVFLPASPERAPYHGDAGAPDRPDGRQRVPIRDTGRGAAPQGQGRQKEGVSVAFGLSGRPIKATRQASFAGRRHGTSSRPPHSPTAAGASP